jgi:hypothetical protein
MVVDLVLEQTFPICVLVTMSSREAPSSAATAKASAADGHDKQATADVPAPSHSWSLSFWDPLTHLPIMPGLVPGIHVLCFGHVVDGRDKPGHDRTYTPILSFSLS